MTIEASTPAGDLLADLADIPMTIEIPDNPDLGAGDSATEGAPADDTGRSEGGDDAAGSESGADAGSADEAGDKEGADGTDADEGEKEPEVAPNKKPSGAQRAKARIEALEAEVAKLRGAVKPEAEVATERSAFVTKRVGAEPKEADYSDFLEFERARTVHAMRVAQAEDAFNDRQATTAEAAEAKQTEIQEAREAHFRELGTEHATRLQSLEKRVPGSVAKIQAAKDLTASRTVAELLLESEKSALLQLHFVEKPDVLAKLNAMSERDAAREMGRIESRLHLPKPKTDTKAPAPVSAPKGGATPSSPDADLSAWLAGKYGA